MNVWLKVCQTNSKHTGADLRADRRTDSVKLRALAARFEMVDLKHPEILKADDNKLHVDGVLCFRRKGERGQRGNKDIKSESSALSGQRTHIARHINIIILINMNIYHNLL